MQLVLGVFAIFIIIVACLAALIVILTLCKKAASKQGLLLRLPCKVGDTLYRIYLDPLVSQREIEPFKIESIVLFDDGTVLFMMDTYYDSICDLKSLLTGEPYLGCFRTFLSYEKAKKALANKSGCAKGSVKKAKTYKI